MSGRGATHALRLGLPGVLLRAAPLRALVLAILVGVFTAGLALVPAWFSARTSDVFASTLEGAGPGQLGLEFGQGGRIAAQPGDPMAGVAAAGAKLEAALPASLAAIAGPHTDLVDTPEYQGVDAPVPVTRVVMRFMPDAATMTRLVEGKAPTGTITEHNLGDLLDNAGHPLVGPNYEAAVSRETADELGLHVGDHLTLLPGANRYGLGVGITITGVFEAVDRGDPRWFDDATLLSPVEVRAGPEVTIYHMIALLSPDAYPAFAPENGVEGFAGGSLRYRWRFPVGSAGASGWDVDQLAADLGRLSVAYPYHGALATDAPGLATGLGEALAAFATQRAIASTAFALAAAGPLVAAAGILALAARAVEDRRRGALRVMRARGTGPRRLLAGLAVAAGLVAVLPGIASGAVVSALSSALGSRSSAVGVAAAAVIVALTAVAVLLLAGAPAVLGPAGARPGRTARRLLSPGRRRVLTGLVVVVALGAGIALKTAGRPAGAPPTATQLVVPALLGMAGGIVLTRVFALGTRGLAAVAARSRGFGLAHALRGLARDAGSRDLPFVVLTVAVTAGILASVVAGSLARAQGVAAANQVGADYRIAALTPAGLPATLDRAKFDAIGPAATIGLAGGSLSSRTLASTFVSVATVSPAAYAKVVDGTLVDPALGEALRSTAAAADATSPVPVVLRGAFAARAGLVPGTELTMTIAGQPMSAVIASVLPQLPGLPPGADAVAAPELLVDKAAASAVPSVVLLRAGPDRGPVDAVVEPYRSQLDVQSRDAVLRGMTDTPMAGAMRDGFALMLALSSLLAGVVVAASLLAALGARAHEAAVLRALGVEERSAQRVVLGEAALTIAVALLTGAVLGLAIAAATVPDLGLAQMAGISGSVVPVADPAGVLFALAGPLVVGLVAILAGARIAGRSAAPARLLAEEA